ncbi:MAG: hypothetical protein RQ715_05965 [Methylococcales bacterium]|nr:hypothetical protein [Methylococcales bacterium]
MKSEQSNVTSQGVEQLITKLRTEAIAEAQEKAEKILLDAQTRAEWLVKEAEEEAALIKSRAQAEADAHRQAGEEALKLASRDALLSLRDRLLGHFSQELKRLTHQQLNKMETLKSLILALAGRVREQTGLDDKNLTLTLPEKVYGVEELKQNPEALHDSPLSRLTASIASDLLRDGVTLSQATEQTSGIIIKSDSDQITIEFTDEAIGRLLLEHLQPRFRALLQGIVK